ncbi:MAG: chemotaxis protein CheW [Candidatus Omnitrophica bacterium]|nr:chemotaxis protein CheW [Candidatus Omnitrophota bacterium]
MTKKDTRPTDIAPKEDRSASGEGRWRVTLHHVKNLPMLNLRALLTLQRLAKIGTIEEAVPDVRADGSLEDGAPLVVRLASDKLPHEIQAIASSPEVVSVEVESWEVSEKGASDRDPGCSCRELGEWVESLSSCYVLADPGCLEDLRELLLLAQRVKSGAVETCDYRGGEIVFELVELLEILVDPQTDSPKDAWERVGKGISALQAISREVQHRCGPRSEKAEGEPADSGVGPGPVMDSRPRASLPTFDPAFVIDASPEMMSCFITESNEHLENANVHLLTIETDPENAESLNAVFRAFHTIKGSAGMLGHRQIAELAHEAENLLGLARDGKLALAEDAIDVIFDTVDMLKGLIEDANNAFASGAPISIEPDLPSLIEKIRRIASGEPQRASSPIESETPGPNKRLGDTLIENGIVTEEAVAEALKAQRHPPARKKIGEILIEANAVSGRKVNAALEIQREHAPDRKLGEILVEGGEISPEDLERALDKQELPPARPKLGEILVRERQVDARDVARGIRGQKVAGAQPSMQIAEPVKVDAARLDRLIDTIGELVIAESMVSQSSELRQVASPQLIRHLTQLNKITRELQEMGTSLRMVPVRATFQRMARLVRDLGKKSGKRVELVMTGEDTELDKTVVDRIGDPLVHMIRNSVDHGIEAHAADRLAGGKPETGRVELRAFHKGGNIYIEVQDDGRGLDRDAILTKAIEKGLVREGESLSDREIFNLIFQPGFSTAKKVTDVSGRGVGMDVVKRNIESLRGQIEILSEPGMGTIFSISLPLTLAIIDGMVVRVAGERYIIPTLSIIQSIRPAPSDISTVLRKGEMLKVQGNLIPLFRLDRLFRVHGAEQAPSQATVVVVENEGKRIGILVDQLLGQQQIVIKPLGETFRGMVGLSGGAIMPDGRVGLILDVAGLVRLAGGCNVPARGLDQGDPLEWIEEILLPEEALCS